jgi:hypothetical protein
MVNSKASLFLFNRKRFTLCFLSFSSLYVVPQSLKQAVLASYKSSLFSFKDMSDRSESHMVVCKGGACAWYFGWDSFDTGQVSLFSAPPLARLIPIHCLGLFAVEVLGMVNQVPLINYKPNQKPVTVKCQRYILAIVPGALCNFIAWGYLLLKYWGW